MKTKALTIRQFRKKLGLPNSPPPQLGRPSNAPLNISNEKVSAIIELFGNNAEMARTLKAKAGLITQWKRRGSIPVSWFRPIYNAAQNKGLPLTLEDIHEADEQKNVK